MFLHRDHDVFPHGQIGEKCPILKHDTPQALQGPNVLRLQVNDVFAEDMHVAGARFLEPCNRPQQYRFPASGRANNSHHFAAADIQIEMFMHDMSAISRLQAAHPDGDIAVHMPSS